VTLAGCATFRAHVPHVPGLPGGPPATFDEAAFARKPTPTQKIRLTPDGATVIGRTRRYRIRNGDTLLDVARWYDLGYNEIVEANPGVDPFVPPVGTEVVVPTEWVLPCCTGSFAW
jgi:L,D-transpeptidase ErfK/SrfK